MGLKPSERSEKPSPRTAIPDMDARTEVRRVVRENLGNHDSEVASCGKRFIWARLPARQLVRHFDQESSFYAPGLHHGEMADMVGMNGHKTVKPHAAGVNSIVQVAAR